MEGKRRRKQSKKTKRSWRKNTDVKDVEEYLQDKQREELVGVPAAEKLDEQLFFVHEESGLNETSTNNDEHPLRVEKTTVRRRKRPLKVDMYLRPISAVEGFPACKRRVVKKYKLRKALEKEKEQRVSQITLEKSGSTSIHGHTDSSSDEEEYDTSASYSEVKRQQLAALKSRMKSNPPKSVHTTVMRDLWADGCVAEEKVDRGDEHYLRVTRKMPIKKPATMMSRPSAIESVQVPHPGMSYNPTFEDHQTLLSTALSVEEEREKAAQKLEKKLQLAELTHHQREQIWLDEMTEGILKDEREKDDQEGEMDERRSVVTKRPVRAEDRKTKKQRRKEREHKEEEQQKRLRKLKKSNMEDVFRLRSIKKEIAEQEVSIAEKKKKQEEEEKNSSFLTNRLGKYVYEEPNLELKLSSEIEGSLQKLKPDGNLAMDRFKSLQRRNMIEPRQIVRPYRKYKLKVKNKRSARLPEDSQFLYET